MLFASIFLFLSFYHYYALLLNYFICIFVFFSISKILGVSLFIGMVRFDYDTLFLAKKMNVVKFMQKSLSVISIKIRKKMF
jgi:hypothetical protein